MAGTALVVRALVLCMVTAGCTSSDATGGRDSEGGDDLSLAAATSSRVSRTDGSIVPAGDLGNGPPLAYVAERDRAVLIFSDEVVEVSQEGDVLETRPLPDPAFGVELAPASDGTAVTVVTPDQAGLEPHTQLLWIDDSTEVLLEVDRELALAGVLPDGIVVREGPGPSSLSVVGWGGEPIRLGLDVLDAMVIPETTLIVNRTDEAAPLRVHDVETGSVRPVANLPGRATFDQIAASPTGGAVVAMLSRVGDDQRHSLGMWLLEASGERVRARRLAETSRGDVLGGFSPDGEWIVLIRHREDDVSLVAHRIADGTTKPVALDPQATPLGWSRAVLTLAEYRPDPH